MPLAPVMTSPGLSARPPGMFSVIGTMPMTSIGAFRSEIARIAPMTAAPPAMSSFIRSMPSAGLIEMPPVSKVMPLPTRPSTGPTGGAWRRVAQHEHPRRLGAAAGDAEQQAHLEPRNLVLVQDLDVQSRARGRWPRRARRRPTASARSPARCRGRAPGCTIRRAPGRVPPPPASAASCPWPVTTSACSSGGAQRSPLL